MVRVVPIDVLPAKRSLGFLAGRGTIGADLKAAFAHDIGAMFESVKLSGPPVFPALGSLATVVGLRASQACVKTVILFEGFVELPLRPQHLYWVATLSRGAR